MANLRLILDKRAERIKMLTVQERKSSWALAGLRPDMRGIIPSRHEDKPDCNPYFPLKDKAFWPITGELSGALRPLFLVNCCSFATSLLV